MTIGWPVPAVVVFNAAITDMGLVVDSASFDVTIAVTSWLAFRDKTSYLQIPVWKAGG